jgi:hypothetical protein
MFRAAANGDAKAGKQLVDLLTRAENARVAGAVENLQHATQYTEHNLAVLAKHEREGTDPPEMYPHPDDFVFNHTTGEVEIKGPLTKEQAGARKAIRERALETMGRYFEVEAALAKDPKNRKLKQEYQELNKYQKILREDSARDFGHKAARIARQATEPKEPEAKDKEAGGEKSEKA